jgi:hypothetical protein
MQTTSSTARMRVLVLYLLVHVFILVRPRTVPARAKKSKEGGKKLITALLNSVTQQANSAPNFLIATIVRPRDPFRIQSTRDQSDIELFYTSNAWYSAWAIPI